MKTQNQSDIGFKLDLDTIKEIPLTKYPKDFSFIVNGKEFLTNRFIADFLSPIICQYHFTDETIDRFYINTSNQSSQEYFSKILSLFTFQPINLSKEDIEYFIEIFSILGNKRELLKLIPKNQEEITIQNVFTIIQIKQNYFQTIHKNLNKNDQNSTFYDDFKDQIRSELDFISSHFYEIDQKEIENLDLDLIEEIIKSDKLELEDEDSLMKLINEIYSKNSKCAHLYSYLNFLYISNKELIHFSEIFNFNDIDYDVWKSIINRLVKSQVIKEELESSKQNRKYKKQEIKGIPLLLNEKEEFNGIIKYLTNKTGGNIHKNGTINLTSTDFYQDPVNILDFNTKCYYQTKLRINDWVVFDFKNRKIKLTNYAIKSNNKGRDGAMKSWKIEVSNDGKTWIKIDDRIRVQSFDKPFEVKENDFSRYVRIYQTDYNWDSNYSWFYYIELYGYLQE